MPVKEALASENVVSTTKEIIRKMMAKPKYSYSIGNRKPQHDKLGVYGFFCFVNMVDIVNTRANFEYNNRKAKT